MTTETNETPVERRLREMAVELKPAPKPIDLMEALRKALANWDKPPSDVPR